MRVRILPSAMAIAWLVVTPALATDEPLVPWQSPVTTKAPPLPDFLRGSETTKAPPLPDFLRGSDTTKAARPPAHMRGSDGYEVSGPNYRVRQGAPPSYSTSAPASSNLPISKRPVALAPLASETTPTPSNPPISMQPIAPALLASDTAEAAPLSDSPNYRMLQQQGVAPLYPTSTPAPSNLPISKVPCPPSDITGTVSNSPGPVAVLEPDRGTVVAALPPEDQPEGGPGKELPPQLRRQLVDYPTSEPAGTVIIDAPHSRWSKADWCRECDRACCRGRGRARRAGCRRRRP